MKLTRSLFNRGLIVSDLKRYWWLSALYTILLFLMLPLSFFMQLERMDEGHVRNQIEGMVDLASHYSTTQILLTLVVPVVIALLVFRYLQLPHAAASHHSLPFTRGQLYLNHLVSGLLLLLFPVLINGVLLALLRITELGEIYSPGELWEWGGYTLLYLLIMYSFAVFVGMFTGNTVAQLAFNYILHLLPFYFYNIIEANLAVMIHGYSRFPLEEPQFLEKLPFMSAMMGGRDLDGLVFWYLLFAFLFLAAAYLAYRFRHLEAAGEIISFAFLKPVFKYGVTFCAMLLGGLYFGETSGSDPAVTLAGYLFSSLLGFAAAEMLLRRTYRVWDAYRGYLVYAVLVLLAFGAIQADVTGGVRHVPDSGEVKGVYFHQQFHQLTRVQEGEEEISELPGFYRERDNLEAIAGLHQKLAERGPADKGRYYQLVYFYPDGDILHREYRVDLEDEELITYLQPLWESEEHKMRKYPVLKKSPDQVAKVKYHRRAAGRESEVVELTGEEIEEFVPILQEEIKELTFEEMKRGEQRRERADIQAVITDDKGNVENYEIKESYRELRSWLEEQEQVE